MASLADFADDSKEIYVALMREEADKVLELCKEFQDGPLHVITIHKDTVLHMATYSKQTDLVLELLKMVSANHLHKMTHQNGVGNTILHEAATSDKLLPAAREMLRMAPRLLDVCNCFNETALYRAARFGKLDMFKLLDHEVNQIGRTVRDVEAYSKAFYQKKDNDTILHTSIVMEEFPLALLIAKEYEYLIGEQDRDGMTALQLLSCNPSAFKKSSRRSLRRLVYSCVSIEEDTIATEGFSIEIVRAGNWEVPLWEAIRKEKERYISALRLAKFLITKDTSWRATERVEDRYHPMTHDYGGETSLEEKEEEEEEKEKEKEKENEVQKLPINTETSMKRVAETPLFLATKSGCVEIVKEILEQYPWAVEHIDSKGRTMLHVAIKYRQIEIFNIVEKMEVPMRRLERKIDNKLNTILHMVGKKRRDHTAREVQSAALQLREDMLLFERVMKICPSHLIKHINFDGQTAEELFEVKTKKLCHEAKDWYKRTAEHCSLVAVLIATVAFAAAYTIPGGPNQNTGIPLLLDQPFFVVFTMTDVLSLTFALTSVIIFLSILTSPFRLKDFKQSLPQNLMLGVTFLIFSVSMMMLAFAATVILMIHNREQWTKIALYTAAFLPVTIFALSYLPLYISLMKTLNYSIKKITMIFPQFTGDSVVSWAANSFSHKFKITNSSKPTQIETSSSTCPPKSKASHTLV
ncbi:hypothetical protein CsSME_00027232 [Camellia sinensis var. sinensis]